MLKIKTYNFLEVLFLFAILPCPVYAGSLIVKFPNSSIPAIDDFGLKVLKLSLEKAQVKYVLTHTPQSLPQERALSEVKKNQDFNLMWAMTTSSREAGFRAIPIPIDKGLIGWRLLLIKKADEAKFKKIKDFKELKMLLAGQGHDWPDTEILKANGFNVFGSSYFEGLFQMLKSGRIDFMSRSVIEIWDELSEYKNQEIIVESTIALHYPAAIYFFVNNQNKELADAIEVGLKTAIKDKSYEKLFTKWSASFISKSNLKDRRVFELNNPLLAESTPLSKKEYWFTK